MLLLVAFAETPVPPAVGGKCWAGRPAQVQKWTDIGGRHS
jgi:hypothetical protein